MAGHSKWANIQHRKGAQDKKRAKIFQKISKEMQVAMKTGNDPDKNPALRLIIEKAKAANMPKDNIERLLSKGDKDTSDWKEVVFEGYGPGGVAVLVECLTDNNNRTVASVKSIFKKKGGNLGTAGSVSYLFETKGIIVLDGNEYNEDEIMMTVMELPIIDFRNEDGALIIETEPNKLLEVKKGLQESGVENFLTSEVTKIATSKVALDDEKADKLQNLIDALEEDDDVSEVHTNVE